MKKRLKVVKSSMSINQIRKLMDVDEEGAKVLKKLAESVDLHITERLGSTRARKHKENQT